MKRPALGLFLAAGLAVASATADVRHDDSSKLLNGLADAVETAQPGELIPVIIVFDQQASQAKLQAATRVNDLGVRREMVIDLLKEVADQTQGDVLDMLAAGQDNGQVGQRVNPMWIANMIAADVSADMAVQLAARADVKYLHLEKVLGEELFPAQPGDPGAAIECGVALMNTPDVWDMGITGAGKVVGMIDTGLCTTHPDIANQLWVNPGETPGNGVDDDNNGFVDDINGWNHWQNNNNLSDGNGHGTHTSGTVAGDGTNGEQTGMAPDAEIMTLKFWNNFGGESVVWNCHEYAMENDADVISASIGWPHNVGPDRPMWRMVCENTFAAGIATVYAAGNEGGNPNTPGNVRTPGDVPDMITVGATDCNDVIAGFSSRGPVTWQNVAPYNDWPFPPGKLKPTVSAPGVNTLSLSNNCNGYFFLSGTSMATPHVAGTVALMLQANPNLDHYEVKQILKDASIDLGQAGPDNVYGQGRVDAKVAVTLAMDMAGCDADINGDGNLDILDFVAFQNAWNAQDPIADWNGDGFFNILDFVDYSSAFKEGCN